MAVKLELGNEQNRKIRHFGMDAEIQAMDGNKSVVQMLDSGNMPSRSFLFAGRDICRGPELPSLDAGFRHPCRNDGPPTLVYNGERWSLGMRRTMSAKRDYSFFVF